MSHQAPGFPLEATIASRPDGTLGIRFTLPGGSDMTVVGPAEPLAEIADTNVMYYPGQFVQIMVLHRHKGPFQLRIPIAELPPHSPPAR